MRQKLQALKSDPSKDFIKNLKAMSYITYLLEKIGITPIVVGGHAVELYTSGSYVTKDIDLVLDGREQASKVLEELGFHREYSRHWIHQELNIPIEIPDNDLAGSKDRLLELQTNEGFKVYVIGIEDLILDRARAAVYWQSTGDREWALFLMSAQWSDIDFEYLESKANEEPKGLYKPDVYETILSLKKEAEKYVRRQKNADGRQE